MRTVIPEILDELPPEDPRARRSRRDLVRVHRALGSAGWFVRTVRTLQPQPRRILELGGGDGTLWLRVAQRLGAAWRGTELTLLDRHDLLEPATSAGYAVAGWRVRSLACDVRDWVGAVRHGSGDGSPPAGAALAERWDLLTTALFLHHFDERELERLLRAVAARGRAFVAWEPRRSVIARLGSRLVGLLGANAVTRQDAVTSVAAGFAGHELGALWHAPGWRIAERPAGPFAHAFVAVNEIAPGGARRAEHGSEPGTPPGTARDSARGAAP